MLVATLNSTRLWSKSVSPSKKNARKPCNRLISPWVFPKAAFFLSVGKSPDVERYSKGVDSNFALILTITEGELVTSAQWCLRHLNTKIPLKYSLICHALLQGSGVFQTLQVSWNVFPSLLRLLAVMIFCQLFNRLILAVANFPNKFTPPKRCFFTWVYRFGTWAFNLQEAGLEQHVVNSNSTWIMKNVVFCKGSMNKHFVRIQTL